MNYRKKSSNQSTLYYLYPIEINLELRKNNSFPYILYN